MSRFRSRRKKSKAKKKPGKKKNIAKVKKKNPKTGRKTYYLGHRVKDTGEPGLNSLREVEGIAKKIYEDYKKGRLTKEEANGRFARLHNTVLPKDSDFKGEKLEKAQEIVKKYWHKLSGD